MICCFVVRVGNGEGWGTFACRRPVQLVYCLLLRSALRASVLYLDRQPQSFNICIEAVFSCL
jgi:hypothetical protein